MQPLKILNSKEIKAILKQIEAQWGAKLRLNYVFLQNSQNKVYIVNRDISKLNLDNLRINSIGLYFCELSKVGIRLSIEGSQIVGPKASKNILEIDKEQSEQWLRGQDLPAEGNHKGFVLIKHRNDFSGTGLFKNGQVLNFVGKERRIAL